MQELAAKHGLNKDASNTEIIMRLTKLPTGTVVVTNPANAINAVAAAAITSSSIPPPTAAPALTTTPPATSDDKALSSKSENVVVKENEKEAVVPALAPAPSNEKKETMDIAAKDSKPEPLSISTAITAGDEEANKDKAKDIKTNTSPTKAKSTPKKKDKQQALSSSPSILVSDSSAKDIPVVALDTASSDQTKEIHNGLNDTKPAPTEDSKNEIPAPKEADTKPIAKEQETAIEAPTEKPSKMEKIEEIKTNDKAEDIKAPEIVLTPPTIEEAAPIVPVTTPITAAADNIAVIEKAKEEKPSEHKIDEKPTSLGITEEKASKPIASPKREAKQEAPKESPKKEAKQEVKQEVPKESPKKKETVVEKKDVSSPKVSEKTEKAKEATAVQSESAKSRPKLWEPKKDPVAVTAKAASNEAATKTPARPSVTPKTPASTSASATHASTASVPKTAPKISPKISDGASVPSYARPTTASSTKTLAAESLSSTAQSTAKTPAASTKERKPLYPGTASSSTSSAAKTPASALKTPASATKQTPSIPQTPLGSAKFSSGSLDTSSDGLNTSISSVPSSARKPLTQVKPFNLSTSRPRLSIGAIDSQTKTPSTTSTSSTFGSAPKSAKKPAKFDLQASLQKPITWEMKLGNKKTSASPSNNSPGAQSQNELKTPMKDRSMDISNASIESQQSSKIE